MGTRRPLIVQMVHDPAALEPRCRLQEEDSEEYGPVIHPEGAIADAIRDRTEAHLRRLGATVSAKPIVMRAEYGGCSWALEGGELGWRAPGARGGALVSEAGRRAAWAFALATALAQASHSLPACAVL